MNKAVMSKFQSDLTKVANDLRIVWNPVIERYQIVQLRQDNISLIYVPDQFKRTNPQKPWILFTIQTEDGSYRGPLHADLLRCIGAVENYSRLQSVGAEKFADELDAKTEKRELRQKVARRKMWQDVDREIQYVIKHQPTLTRLSE